MAGDGRGEGGGVAQVGREVGGPGVVGAGLEQQHAAAGVGQPGGQRAARGPRAHHDDVPAGAHSPSASGRSSRRTLPVEVRGSSATRCRLFGRLAADSRSRAQAPSSAGSAVPT